MTLIQAQRRYWAYEDMTLQLEDVLQDLDDPDAQRAAPYLTAIQAEYEPTGSLLIHFASPDGLRYRGRVYAVPPDEEDVSAYNWIVEIEPDAEGEPTVVDYEETFYQPPNGPPIRFQDLMGALVAIAEAVYAESDVDYGSPNSVMCADGLDGFEYE
ncbi:MAG TPA: hypothetical protein VFB38_24715 [Chthonomonadaceae bacterium]|nr:hypothetical protein [Chthonomonadaceae bacterium]